MVLGDILGLLTKGIVTSYSPEIKVIFHLLKLVFTFALHTICLIGFLLVSKI